MANFSGFIISSVYHKKYPMKNLNITQATTNQSHCFDVQIRIFSEESVIFVHFFSPWLFTNSLCISQPFHDSLMNIICCEYELWCEKETPAEWQSEGITDFYSKWWQILKYESTSRSSFAVLSMYSFNGFSQFLFMFFNYSLMFSRN